MKSLLTLILCIAAPALWAQTTTTPATGAVQRTTTVSGRVLSGADSTALVNALVVASTDGRLYATGNDNGYFSINNIPLSTSDVVVSFLGHETRQVTFTIKGSAVNLGDIYMTPLSNTINTVVVTAEVPMAVQMGDTTQFNAAAFKVSPDADADGLLAKMPGMVIENGKVEAQGEEVKRVYVDGKLWMGDDPIATLKNIPADAIESIQMFDEKSEESKLTGFDDGDTRRALNVVTKAKNTKAIIIRSEEALGSNMESDNRKTLYQASNSFMLFTQKHRFGVSVNANNIGSSNSSFRPGMSDGGSTPTGNQKVVNTGLNYSFEGAKLKLSSSYMFNRNVNSGWNNTETFRRVLGLDGQDSTYTYTHTNSSSQSGSLSRNHGANLRLEWKPTDRHVITFTPNISFGDGFTRRDNISARVDLLDKETMEVLDSVSRRHVVSLSENSRFSTTGALSWMYRINTTGTALSLNISYNLGNNTSSREPNYLYDLEWDSAANSWVQPTTARENPRTSDSYNDQIRANLALSLPLSKHHRLMFALASEYNWTNSVVKAYDQNVTPHVIDRTQSTTIARNYQTLGGRIGYTYNKDKIKFDAGTEFQRLEQKRELSFPVSKDMAHVFYNFRPTASFRYTMDRRKYLQFSYRGAAILPSLEHLSDYVNISSSGNSITIGNPDLKQGYRHNFTMRYNDANTAKSTNFNMSINGSIQRDFVATRGDYIYADKIIYAYGDPALGVKPQYGASVVEYRNMNGYYSTNINTGYSFPWKAIKSNINLSARYGLTHRPSIYAEEIRTGGTVIVGGVTRPEYMVLHHDNIQMSHNMNFRVGLASNISEKIDFNITSSSTLTMTRNTARSNNNNYFVENLSYTMNFILPASFTITSTANWMYNKTWGSTASSAASNSYVLMNIGLGKKFFKSKTGEFRITAYDLFNQNRSYTYTDTGDVSRYVRSEILGRYVLARLSYRFNSMRGKSSAPASGRIMTIREGGQRTEVVDGFAPGGEGVRYRMGGGGSHGGGSHGGGSF